MVSLLTQTAEPVLPLMDVKRVQDALQQLHLGHTLVEFPPKAIESRNAFLYNPWELI